MTIVDRFTQRKTKLQEFTGSVDPNVIMSGRKSIIKEDNFQKSTKLRLPREELEKNIRRKQKERHLNNERKHTKIPNIESG